MAGPRQYAGGDQVKERIDVEEFMGLVTLAAEGSINDSAAVIADEVVFDAAGSFMRRPGMAKAQADLKDAIIKICDFSPSDGIRNFVDSSSPPITITNVQGWPQENLTTYPALNNIVTKLMPATTAPSQPSGQVYGANALQVKVANAAFVGVQEVPFVPGHASSFAILFAKTIDLSASGLSLSVRLLITGAPSSWNPSKFTIRLYSSAGGFMESPAFNSTNLLTGWNVYTIAASAFVSNGGATLATINGMTIAFSITSGAPFVAQDVWMADLFAFLPVGTNRKAVGSSKAWNVSQQLRAHCYGGELALDQGTLPTNVPLKDLVYDDRIYSSVCAGQVCLANSLEARRLHENGWVPMGIPAPTADAFTITGFGGDSIQEGFTANNPPFRTTYVYCITYEDDYGNESNMSPRRKTTNTVTPPIGVGNSPAIVVAPPPAGIKKVNIYRQFVDTANQIWFHGPYRLVGSLTGWGTSDQTFTDTTADSVLKTVQRCAPAPHPFPVPWGQAIATYLPGANAEVNDSSPPPSGIVALAVQSYEGGERMLAAVNVTPSVVPIGGPGGLTGPPVSP